MERGGWKDEYKGMEGEVKMDGGRSMKRGG